MPTPREFELTGYPLRPSQLVPVILPSAGTSNPYADPLIRQSHDDGLSEGTEVFEIRRWRRRIATCSRAGRGGSVGSAEWNDGMPRRRAGDKGRRPCKAFSFVVFSIGPAHLKSPWNETSDRTGDGQGVVKQRQGIGKQGQGHD